MNEQTASPATLIKATIIATLVAAVILLTVILPAEYNIDPTGLGEQLGLTQLSQSAQEAAASQTSSSSTLPQIFPLAGETANENSDSQSAASEDSVEVIVDAGRGIEYKFQLEQFKTMKYQWQTADKEPLFFDLHGEPEGDTTGYYESYTIATSHEMKGQFTAPFTGIHGWYWKNSSDKAVTITLKTSGNYRIVGLK